MNIVFWIEEKIIEQSLKGHHDEEKVSKLKKLCKLQIEHFVKYRDILPEIQDLLKVEDFL